MASLSRVNVQVGFQGQEAVAGFEQVSNSAKKTTGEVDKLNQKAEQGGKAAGSSGMKWTELKSKLDLFLGGIGKVAGAVEAFAALGAELQTTQIRLAYVTGSWEEAGRVLEDVRQQSMETGQSFAGMVDGLQKLTSVGLSAGAAATVLERMGNAAELLGAQGMSSLAGSINQLMRAGTATEGALMSLQDQGLDVFGALGDSLSKVTGKAYTTEEAIRAIRRGAVSSAQAIEAIDAASNSPKAREAAQRFFGSFEGQVARLKTTMEDTFREISKLFLEAFDWAAVAAGLRGTFSAVRDIVKEIADTFLPVIDPKNKAEGIEKSFRLIRDVTFEVGQQFSMTMLKLGDSLTQILDNVTFAIEKASAILEGGIKGWATGATDEEIGKAENRLARKDFNRNMDFLDRQKGLEDFWGKVRGNAAANDDKRAQKMGMENLFGGGVFDTLKEGAKALAEQVKQAAAKMQMAEITFEKTALDLEENFATPAEQFQKAMADVGNQLKDARARLAKGDPLLGRVEAGLQRKAGKQIMDFLKENEVGTSWQASRADKGSAAAMETILRNRFGEQGQDVQQRIKGALDLANRLAQQQLAAQERAIAAFENARPGVLAFK
jgi:Tape measure protein